MNNNRKNSNKKSSVLPIVILVILFSALRNTADREMQVILTGIFAAVLLLALIPVLTGKKKTKAGREEKAAPVRAAEDRRQPARGGKEREREEAVRCHHSRGKEKYIEQLDSYLKAGLIDRAEYRVLRERYEKLDLPDDYH